MPMTVGTPHSIPELETTPDNIMLAALNLSARAYSDKHLDDQPVIDAVNARIQSWTPLEATTLGFAGNDPGFSIIGGSLLRYINENASATVGLTILDGKRTLGISFEGSNDISTENGLKDWNHNVFSIKGYYDLLNDADNDNAIGFLQSIVNYINANDIEQVLVTGHSLGGAAAQFFMQDYGVTDARYIGVTFGSPGTNRFQTLPEERFANIRHNDDEAVIAGDARGYEVSGSIINIRVEDSGIDGLSEHTLFIPLNDSKISYRRSVEFITSQLDAETLFRDMNIVPGTNGDDNLNAKEGQNVEVLLGGNGADSMTGEVPGEQHVQIFKGGLGNDAIHGGGGIDYALYSGARSDFTHRISPAGEFIVIDQRTAPNNEGTDTLKDIERIILTDMAFALDVDGSAGRVAKLIGAVFGAGSVSNTHYVAIGLSELDKGTGYEDLAAFAIAAAGANTPEQVTSLLWGNVVGSPPTADQAQPYIDMLNSGTSIGELGVFAAEHPINQANIALTELRETGIVFDPLGFVV
ncbi:hypothetical protein [Nitrosomonas sp. Nm132]|uniref:lipase family protein n=1 Tax=Nitrosomonas sp. Nm132 TaxID=1881053 RepID=UPI000890650F|nr:hypothetical protein [Nitrosomonas sp. Nm132]SDI07037.1 Lipase (class 3) [Nitrosomonas sp. Nm132]